MEVYNNSNMLSFDDDDNLVTTNNYSNIDFLKFNYSDEQSIWVRKPLWEVTLKSMAMVPIMGLGLIGNSAIILIISRIKSLRKSTVNLFILNMAIADFLTTL
jgi:hypothetical protein